MQSLLLGKKKLLFAIVSFLLLSLGLFFLILFNEPVVQIIPLNNLQAEYIIEKRGETYTISYKDAEQSVKGVMIGNSPVNLEPYVDKKVQIQGKFENNKTTQCIAGQCRSIGGPYVALNITSIQEKNF